MLHRRFGRTQIQMPVFSCGGMRYQHTWKDLPLEEIPADKQANLEATIRRSVQVGINHIETARGYGSSERQLGCILPTFPRNELIVQTKISPEEDAGVFRKHFEESLERLRLDHVDLLAIHGINNEYTYEISTRKNGCLAMARQLQSEGLAHHIGFSTHALPEQVTKFICHERDGGFDYVNLHWYYIYQRNWQAVLEAKKRDMGMFIISPSDKGGMLYNPTPKLIELTAPLHPIVFNDLFCLTRPEVHTLSIGAARPTDFDLHLQAVELYDRREELLPPIIARLEEEMAKTVGDEYSRRFLEGIPEWEQTPGNINIPIILWLRNLTLAYGMETYAKMRYGLLGNADHWFPGMNAGNLEEVDLSPTLAGSPFADHIPKHLREAHELLWTEPKKRLSEG